MLRILFAPINYLRARNSHKWRWDWPIPALIAAALLGAYELLPVPFAFLGDGGLVAGINELLQLLVGFYIASLAAIASFDRVSLDQPIEGGGVLLRVVRGGETIDRSLTRRTFLSYMFGYLSLLSILLYCGGLLTNLLAPNAAYVWPEVVGVLRIVFASTYLFFVSQLMTITLVAIYYLCDRIHRQTPIALPPEKLNPSDPAAKPLP